MTISPTCMMRLRKSSAEGRDQSVNNCGATVATISRTRKRHAEISKQAAQIFTWRPSRSRLSDLDDICWICSMQYNYITCLQSLGDPKCFVTDDSFNHFMN